MARGPHTRSAHHLISLGSWGSSASQEAYPGNSGIVISQTINHPEYGEAVRVRGDGLVVDVTVARGPRIIAFSREGGANILAVTPELGLDTPAGHWRPLGGHRLWAAPEAFPQTYTLDDARVHVERGDAEIAFVAPLDPHGPPLQKTIAVRFNAGRLVVRHTLANRGDAAVTAAAWGITMLVPGGTIVIPQEPFRPHPDALLPSRALVLWPYTQMDDPRWRFGSRFIRLHADSSREQPQKIGAQNHVGWCAYLHPSATFVKRACFDPDATYADLGASTQTFVAGPVAELETLGPLVTLAPGAQTVHEEVWSLHDAVDAHLDDDALATALRGVA